MLDDDEPRFGLASPLEWFFGPHARIPRKFAHAPFSWSSLESYGWRGEYLDAVEYDEFPAVPGVYVLAHEVDSRTLYVGQSRNLKMRIHKIRHQKIKELIRLYEEAHAGYHNRGDPASEIRVFYKAVESPYAALTLSQALIWCEAIAIGLLCPLAQGNTTELERQNIQIGRDFF